MRNQRTLKTQVEISGVGLHTGAKVKAVLKPSPADTGIVFERVDLDGAPEIPANADSIVPANRRTTLRNGIAEVDTVEHFLSACHGLGVDNLRVELNGPEFPSADGSARPIADTLLAAGIVEQKSPKKIFKVEEPIYVREKDASIVALPSDEPGLKIQYHFSYPNYAPRTVHYKVDSEDYRDTIAPARTFVMEEEIEALKAKGLGKGANAENTVVMRHHGKPPEMRFPDEYARHKVLDLLGDIYLAGAEIHGHLIATKSGHSTNAKFVKRVVEELQGREERGQLAHSTALDIKEVMKILPHRYPFLLIDRVIEVDGHRKAVGLKNVTINEPFFVGHWPSAPVMPGVLILESMAQLAGVLLLRKLENTGKLGVLIGIDKVRMRGTVVPGDQLRIEVETVKAKRDLAQVEGRAKVNGKLVSEAQLMFSMIEA